MFKNPSPHCIGMLSTRYCVNTREAKFNKKITCAMLAQSTQSSFHGIITYENFSWSGWPTLHKKTTWTMLANSPQTNFHKKIIHNFVWIYLGQHSTRKLLVECWIMADRQPLWEKRHIAIQCWFNTFGSASSD